MGASSQKKLHVHLVDEKAMDDEILTMVAELKLVHGMVLRFKLDWASPRRKEKEFICWEYILELKINLEKSR